MKGLPSGRSTRTIAAGILSLTGLAACEPGGGEALGGADGALVFLPSDVNLLGTSDVIASVQDLEVLPNGTVWVLNSIEPFFIAFGSDGQVLHTHGQSGGGPGEFQGPAGFVAGGIDGEAWVYDWARHAFLQVSRPDAAPLEISIPSDRIPPGTVLEGMNLLRFGRVRTARLGSEIVLPRATIEGEIQASRYWFYAWNPDLVGLHVRTDSVRTAIALAEVLGDPTPHIPAAEYPPFPLWFRLWGVCGEDEIRVYDRIRNQVRRFDSRGLELEPTALPAPRFTEVTRDEFARATLELAAIELMGEVPAGPLQLSPEDSAHVLNGLMPRITLEPTQLAGLLPRYVDYRCDEAGTQWIQPIDLQYGGLNGGPLWLRIGADGEVREVRLPDRFDSFRFTSNRIWGVQRDEFNVASIGWIDLPPTR